MVTLHEYLFTLFRLEERARAFFVDDANVLAAIALTVALVVGAEEGARGLLLGSYASGAAFVLGLIVVHRRRLSLWIDGALLRRMLRFGLPTMPAELSLYALNFVDRIIIVRTVGLAEAGLYSLAVKFAQAVNVLVRGFQLAWPPLAYSIRDDDEARRAYARSSPGSSPAAPSSSSACGCSRAGSCAPWPRRSSSSPTKRSA